MTADEARQKQLVQLKEILIHWFSSEELEDASFDLGLDFRALGGSTKEANVRNLIMELSRRGRLTQLLEWCDQHRPEIEWGLFTHLRQTHQPAVVPERRSGNGVLLTLVGVMFSVMVIGAVAASFFFTRTTQPTPTPAQPILQVPLLETTTAQQPAVQVTPTNVIVTAIPVGNAEPSPEPTEGPAVSPTPTQPQPVETATLPSDIVNLDGPPYKLQITDTYQGNPLDKANIRSGPGLEYGVVAQLGANVEITVQAYAYNSTGIPWYLIDLGGGKFGWISGVLVVLDLVPFDSIPPAATVPPTNTPPPTATPTETPVPSPTPQPTADQA
ncbi:MAG: SH3 domain-containing protein [Chloroflexota bacterium]